MATSKKDVFTGEDPSGLPSVEERRRTREARTAQYTRADNARPDPFEGMTNEEVKAQWVAGGRQKFTYSSDGKKRFWTPMYRYMHNWTYAVNDAVSNLFGGGQAYRDAGSPPIDLRPYGITMSEDKIAAVDDWYSNNPLPESSGRDTGDGRHDPNSPSLAHYNRQYGAGGNRPTQRADPKGFSTVQQGGNITGPDGTVYNMLEDAGRTAYNAAYTAAPVYDPNAPPPAPAEPMGSLRDFMGSMNPQQQQYVTNQAQNYFGGNNGDMMKSFNNFSTNNPDMMNSFSNMGGKGGGAMDQKASFQTNSPTPPATGPANRWDWGGSIAPEPAAQTTAGAGKGGTPQPTNFTGSLGTTQPTAGAGKGGTPPPTTGAGKGGTTQPTQPMYSGGLTRTRRYS